MSFHEGWEGAALAGLAAALEVFLAVVFLALVALVALAPFLGVGSGEVRGD